MSNRTEFKGKSTLLGSLYKKTKSFLTREIRFFTSENTSSLTQAPVIPNWFWQALLGVPRRINPVELRQYAKSAWVQMVKRTVKNQVMTTEWGIVNSDEEEKADYSEDIEKATTFLNYPNRNGDTFWEVWGPFVDDVMDLDAGVVWKGKNVVGELVEIFPHDGSRFLTKIDEHGIKEGYYQYSYKYPAGAPLWFEKDEIIYGKIGTNTDQYPYGWSPLQSIQQVVELMIQSDRYNKEYFKNNAIPDGLINVDMEDDAMDRYKNYWESEVKGKPHKLIFSNAKDAKFLPMSLSNKDMQWLDGQKWYFHVVFGSYGLSPQEVGFYENSNRSTGESQERVSVRNAVRPYLTLIEEKINREIFPDLIGHDKVKFKWFPKDSQAEKQEHEQTMAKLKANILTINEVRAKEGLEDVEWGDEPVKTGGLFVQGQDIPEEQGKGKPKEEEKVKPKEGEKKKEAETVKARSSYKDSFRSFMKNVKQRFIKTSN